MAGTLLILHVYHTTFAKTTTTKNSRNTKSTIGFVPLILLHSIIALANNTKLGQGIGSFAQTSGKHGLPADGAAFGYTVYLAPARRS